MVKSSVEKVDGNWRTYSQADLRQECKDRGLKVRGNKSDLISRLEANAPVKEIAKEHKRKREHRSKRDKKEKDEKEEKEEEISSTSTPKKDNTATQAHLRVCHVPHK